VVDLLIVAVVVAVPVLYAADRIIKARAQARRVRTMSERLAAATTRADEQQERRQEAAEFSAALTSVMPAIKRPPLSLPDSLSPAAPLADGSLPGESPETAPPPAKAPAPSDATPSPAVSPHDEPPHDEPPHSTPPHGTARPRTGCAHTGPQEHVHRRRPSRTGEHNVRSADRAAG
jgi:hypothetical protein